MAYDVDSVTVPKKGGRPKWEDRPGDGRVMWTAWLYESQRDWLKSQPGGGGEWLRRAIERGMRRGDEKARKDRSLD